MSIDFGSRRLASVQGPMESIWFKALMRFGLYLMLVAFLIMGAEVAYALYQLASLIL
jgi:K+ transporter